MSFRVVMGLRPTHRDESQKRRRPRVSGDRHRVDSRFRGNDVTFERAQRGISLGFAISDAPEQREIPRSDRNDTPFSWFLGAGQPTGMGDCVVSSALFKPQIRRRDPVPGFIYPLFQVRLASFWLHFGEKQHLFRKKSLILCPFLHPS